MVEESSNPVAHLGADVFLSKRLLCMVYHDIYVLRYLLELLER